MTRRKPPQRAPEPSAVYSIRVPPEQLARWRAACEAMGVDVSATLRYAMDAYLERDQLDDLAELGRTVVEAVRAHKRRVERCPYGHPVSDEPGGCLPGSCGWR